MSHLRTALGSCTSVHCILCISYAAILTLHPLQPWSLLELIGYARSDLVCPYMWQFCTIQAIVDLSISVHPSPFSLLDLHWCSLQNLSRKKITAHHSRIPEHSSINKILQRGERQWLFPKNKKFSSILFYHQMKKLSAAIRIGKQILETYQCICGDDSTKHF